MWFACIRSGGGVPPGGEQLVIAAEQVHAAHADAWELEGRARALHGGGSGRVRGARLMASGLPDARWNNADVEDQDVDLDAVIAWYESRAVPWGIRVPQRLTIDLGTPLFVKRCFAMRSGELPDSEQEVGARLSRVRAAGLSRFVAAEAGLFGMPSWLAARWISPVFGKPGFAHWVAERDRRPVAVATTVASAGDAGPAVMLTGLGSLPHADRRLVMALARTAILAAVDDEPAALVHTHGDPDDDPELYDRLGFTEVEGLQVRVVKDR
jgi:hypothetical protein